MTPMTRSDAMRVVLFGLRPFMWSAAGYSVVINLLMLVPTLYMLQVYDRVLVNRNEVTLLVVSLLAAALIALSALADGLRGRLQARASAWLDRALAPHVFELACRAGRYARGATEGRTVLQDFQTCRNFIGGAGAAMLFDLIWAPIYIAVAYLLHPVLGLAALGAGVVQIVLAAWSRTTLMQHWLACQIADANAQRFVQGKLQQAEITEALGMVPALAERWRQVHAVQLDHEWTWSAARARMAGIAKGVRYGQQALLLGVGALLVIDGELSAGAMIAANLLVTRALAPLDQLASQWQAWLGARQAWQRLDMLFKEPSSEVVARESARPSSLDPGQCGLVVRGVHLFMPGREEAVLHDIHFELAPGQIMVVMGPSGSGKSTLARYLAGACPDPQDAVCLAGRSLAQYVQQGGSVGYLPQDLAWLPGSVAQQIARFEDPMAPEAVVQAAQSAGLHDMILSLPKGYDTWIDAGTSAVSGGQLQRIALARALYGTPELMVLDEPNANLDEDGERALAAALDALRRRGGMAVVVSHRPGVLALADLVLVLRNGRVVHQEAAADMLRSLQTRAIHPNKPSLG